MRYTRLLLPTVKETPAEAEVISHKLMLRSGMIRKLAAGIYSFLPLGYRVIRKVENIVREEMDRAGGQEVFLPVLNPAELWMESGRWDLYGKELMRLKDRHGREFCLGPTHEEVITDIVRREIRSYRQLPMCFYQIQTKFRDEIRPRFGIMRGREFGMKDAYSFDRDEKGAEESYHEMFKAYQRIFERCGLKFKPVEADSGLIGGSFSHEFMVLAESGENVILSCKSCSYAANVEKAEVRLQDIKIEKQEKQQLKKVTTPNMKTVEEVTNFLKKKPEELIKTILYQSDEKVIAVLVRGDHEVNEIKLKNLLKSKELTLADEKNIEKATNSPVGFAGPVNLKNIQIIADNNVKNMTNFVVGGNEKDIHFINANINRDFEVDLFADIRIAVGGDPCPLCGKQLESIRGIEVGHVFKLGTKYSKSLQAVYLDEQGRQQLIVMGCYGIGIGRTVAAAIEQNYDENGIIWPLAIAPFQVLVLPINSNNEEVMRLAEEIYTQLLDEGYEVLLDDRKERPGVKFNDADLIGIPIRIMIGSRSIKEGVIEIKLRKTGEIVKVKNEEVVDTLSALRIKLM